MANPEILISGLDNPESLILQGLESVTIPNTLSFKILAYKDLQTETMLTGSINKNIAEFHRVIALNPGSQTNDINTYIDCEHYNLKSCISFNNWISNVENNCSLKEIETSEGKFIPVLNNGSYSIFDRLQRFFSSYSVNLLIEDNTKVYNFVKKKLLDGVISIYRRDSKYNNVPVFQYEPRITYNKEDSIIDITDLDYPAYPIVNSETIDNSFMNLDKLNNYYEKYEQSQLSNFATLYSKYFPIKPESLKIYITTDTNVIQEYDAPYSVNYNNGIINIQGIDSNVKCFYILYTTTPRLDYEILDTNKVRFDNSLDLRPKNNFYQTGAIVINYAERNLKKIELSISKDEVFIGSDIAILTATCFDSNENTVSEVSVYFEFVEENENSNLGLLNNQMLGAFDYTDSEGQARCTYFAPYKEDSLKFSPSSINGSNIIFQTNYTAISNSEVSLFFYKDTVNPDEDYDIWFNDRELVLVYQFLVNSYIPVVPRKITNSNDIVTLYYQYPFQIIDPTKYCIFAPKKVNLRAYAIDPATNKKIESNVISVKLSFPYYLRGKRENDYGGYRFSLSSFNEFATGLGGSNYFTINKDESEVFKTLILNKR